MQYAGNLLVVKDIEKSKKFYQEVLGLQIVSDFGANITLNGGISLQELQSWLMLIGKKDSDLRFGSNTAEIYFEENDLDAFAFKLATLEDIKHVHGIKEFPWGQRSLRFYDPDGHMIEVGENMIIVVTRFINSGLSREETAQRMDVPLEYINFCLQ